MKSMKLIKNAGAPDARMRGAIEHCADRLIRAGIGLSGVVLTGSFARGEGTLVEENGKLKVLSDVEFLAVVEDGKGLSGISARLKQEEAALGDELKEMGVDCKIDVTPALRRYFRNARPSIFAYELKAHGQVLRGESRVLDDMPSFSRSDIPRMDAFYLLNNRIMEQLENYCSLSSGNHGAAEKAAYGIAKFYLDLATSILTFEGAYVPTYRARAGALKTLRPAGLMETEEYAGLLRKVDHWTSVKLSPTRSVFTQEAERALSDWKELAGYVHEVWRWELSAILAMNGETALLARRFAAECASSEAAVQWLKLAYRAIRIRKLRGLAGARFSLRHPRHLLYMNAALRYFKLSGAAEGDGMSSSIASTMPLKTRALGSESIPELVSFWTDYFRNC
ncbi:MAG TPA: hypothetical protein DDW94_02870 [Deltaproteobacteria bacterium]|nr:MAG: hypothetical protein A2Z79_08975 [Deltaproteobacteria bacterium GWA2_55_82]OGQ64599.1 MAG: hypothetical protein A3I81_11240 [Deltaproteobacteria bacterium RIFCSPLOWO2_02_FULL_55_12]OIJ73697.1 MAG: hypothetical protein A2V21_305110 [Deltaproteobacteria bacterium GWC2_55_46]HBG45910.1 hypothetical protein [Deltaproteobacteria bacterium]HCY09671.1 hypothetical protein [Deltaproteobacteria bacterium]